MPLRPQSPTSLAQSRSVVRPVRMCQGSSRCSSVDVHNGGRDSLADEDMPLYYRAFERIAADSRQTLFVAEHAGRIVGTFQLTFTQTLVYRARLRATIESVHVLASLRGGGIGAAMMQHAVKVARENGAGLVQLASNKARGDAHRFYERLGFKKSHEGFKLEL